MPLSPDLVTASKRMRERAHELSGYLNELEKRLSGDEATRRAFTNARQTVGFIHSECTQVETLIGSGRMCGELAVELTATDLELHPANQADPEREKFLKSLHRAGDHTLDQGGSD